MDGSRHPNNEDKGARKHQHSKRAREDSKALARQLKEEGVSGQALMEALATAVVLRKQQECANRCSRCWHDAYQRCICHQVLPHTPLTLDPLLLFWVVFFVCLVWSCRCLFVSSSFIFAAPSSFPSLASFYYMCCLISL